MKRNRLFVARSSARFVVFFVVITLVGACSDSSGDSGGTADLSPDSSPTDGDSVNITDVTAEPDVPVDPRADIAVDMEAEDLIVIVDAGFPDTAIDGVDTVSDVDESDISDGLAADMLTDIAPDVVTDCGGCEEGSVCVDNVCKPIVCDPGTVICVNKLTVAKCDPFGSAYYPAPCLKGYQCVDGICKSAQANVLILFDTSSSMTSGGGGGAWPACDFPATPTTKFGHSKKAFTDVLGKNQKNPARFFLLRFPQQENFIMDPFCPSGYVQGIGNMTGDTGEHEPALGAPWFIDNHKQVVVVGAGSEEGDNLNTVLSWLDFYESAHFVADTACDNCDGICGNGGCIVHSDPELRTSSGTPLGKTMFYAGEYVRQFVSIEGKPCDETNPCSNSHYECVDGFCHDEAANCRETVLVVFTDGADSQNSAPTDYFNPINQAKRFNLGLGCQTATDCVPGAQCIGGTCLPAGVSDYAKMLVDPTVGTCDNSLTPCSIATPNSCPTVGAQCKKVLNTFTDSQGVQLLRGYNGKPIRIRVHVIDAALFGGEANAESNRDTALFGGGLYIPVNAEVAAELTKAISLVTDPKPNLGCF
ncbi:MAG: hypothetical protein HUU55_23535 [Myxococcales bacterium]|nr:hypothetical protein [Myxococcales bacterium]